MTKDLLSRITSIWWIEDVSLLPVDQVAAIVLLRDDKPGITHPNM